MSVDNPNLAILEHVAKRLDCLVDDVVFLGGCACGQVDSNHQITRR